MSEAAPSRPATVAPKEFRNALSHFCTGITVITADDGTERAGFACQSFASVSLDPPLVLFCPTRTSKTWPVIERAGRLAVNVLAAHQVDVSAAFGRSGPDKFSAGTWHRSPGGAPVLEGALAWLEAEVDTVREAGDHYLVLARVTEIGSTAEDRPLLFFRSRYSTSEIPAATGAWAGWAHPDDWF